METVKTNSEKYPNFPYGEVDDISSQLTGSYKRHTLLFMLDVFSQYEGNDRGAIEEAVDIIRNIIMLLDTLEEYFNDLKD